MSSVDGRSHSCRLRPGGSSIREFIQRSNERLSKVREGQTLVNVIRDQQLVKTSFTSNSPMLPNGYIKTCRRLCACPNAVLAAAPVLLQPSSAAAGSWASGPFWLAIQPSQGWY